MFRRLLHWSPTSRVSVCLASMASRSLHEARRAAERNDVTASRAAHLSAAMDGAMAYERQGNANETHNKAGEHMKTIIFGGLDGIITTFAVVAGAGGGGLSVDTVLIMGFSSLVADALSMGVGDALSSKAESEVASKERRREKWELDNYPEGAPAIPQYGHSSKLFRPFLPLRDPSCSTVSARRALSACRRDQGDG